LSRLIFLSQQHLRTTLATFADYYRLRRNHQGIENKLIDPPTSLPEVGHIQCRKELRGMLNYYREAACTTIFQRQAQFFGSKGEIIVMLPVRPPLPLTATWKPSAACAA
jgi:hypothetical protein